MHGFRARLDYWLKHSNTFYRIFNVIVSFALRVLGLFVRLDRKMILFSAHSRKYNDSPKTIYEYMIKNYSNKAGTALAFFIGIFSILR